MKRYCHYTIFYVELSFNILQEKNVIALLYVVFASQIPQRQIRITKRIFTWALPLKKLCTDLVWEYFSTPKKTVGAGGSPLQFFVIKNWVKDLDSSLDFLTLQV